MTVKPDFGGRFPCGTHVYRAPCLHLDSVLADLPGIRVIDRPEDRHSYRLLHSDTGVSVPS